jgi:photosystem II stability/assembly factor-like uncharacterized protein
MFYLRFLKFWLTGMILFFTCFPVSAHRPHDPVHTIALSPTFSTDQTIFIGQNPAYFWRIQDVLRSDDGGLTWAELPNGMNNRSAISSISISPNFPNDQTAFITAKEDGVFRSINGGSSWVRANGNLPTLQIVASAIAISPVGNLVFFVSGKNGGLYRTDNLGSSWIQVISPSIKVDLLAISPDFEIDSTVFIVDDSMRILSSENGGQSWGDHGKVTGAGKIYALAVAPQFSVFGEVFIGAQGGVYQSTDFLNSFVKRNGGLPAESVTTLAVSPNYREDTTLICTSLTMAVFKSIDAGQTWHHYNANAKLTGQTEPDREFRALRFSQGFVTDNTVFLAAFDGLFKSIDGGESWVEFQTRTNLVTGLGISPDFTSDATLAASTYYGGGVYISTDRGKSWIVKNNGIEMGRGRICDYDVEFAPKVVGNEDPVLFSNRPNYFLRLEYPGSGSDWVQTKLPNFQSFPPAIYPTKIEISPEYMYTGTRSHGLYYSQNDGETWAQSLTGKGRITSLRLSPESLADHTVFAATDRGMVYRSTNDGLSWTEIVAGLPNRRGSVWLAVSPGFAVDRMLLAGTTRGLYRTDDEGNSWWPIDTQPVVSGVIEHVEFSPTFPQDNIIFVVARGAGLFSSDNAGLSWKAVGNQLIDNGIQFSDFRLSPNFAVDGTIFGITRSHIYRSIDKGQSWERVADFWRSNVLPAEFGEVPVDHTWTQVTFDNSFRDPVVIAKPLSHNDQAPAVVRIRNVNSLGFEIRIQEWDYLDGLHPTEIVGYLAVERGNYVLANGKILVEADRFATNRTRVMAAVPFRQPFEFVPVIIAAVDSFNGGQAVTTRLRNVNSQGFKFRMQEQELNAQGHTTESIAYIAWEPSSGTLDDLTFEIGRTPDKVQHNFHPIVFDETFLNIPVFLADMQTTDGGDTANLRYQNKDLDGVDVQIDEEQSSDVETFHTTEVVGYMLFAPNN